MGSLTSGNVKEAWRTLQGWYREAGEKAPKPCYDTMEAQTVEREKLYSRIPPPRDKIPSYVQRPPMNDAHTADEEVRRAVKKSHNGRSGGASKMRAEDLKIWLTGVENEEQAREKGEYGYEGTGDTWRLLLKLICHIWDTGDIPRQMLLTIVVLIPKGNSGDYRGIGLLEVVWKLIKRVLDERMSAIEVHDSLHGFRAKRGCGTGIMEAKLVQQLTFVEQAPLFGIFIDLRKAYNAMDRERCIDICVEAGVGPNAVQLVVNFWEGGNGYCRAARYYGRVFKAKRGITQGGPLSPPSSTAWWTPSYERG